MSKPRRNHGPDWHWRSFPVLAAFVFGALAASLLDPPNTNFALGVRVMLVLAAGYCAAHIAIIYVLLPRRLRARSDGAGEADVDDEASFDDELVFEPTKNS